MIGAIRRRFANSANEDSWGVDQKLAPEGGESPELHAGSTVLLAAKSSPGYFPGDQSLTDYYKGIVVTAIDNRGRYGDHWIPVPWLRMILAGLESGQVDPGLLWYEADSEHLIPRAELPPFEDLFRSESDPADRLK